MTTPSLIDVLQHFYEYLRAGEAEPLVQVFSGEPEINTPLGGAVVGHDAFRQFVVSQQAWLNEHQATPHVFNLIDAPERVVVEFVIDLQQDDKAFDLPVALVAERAGEQVQSIRIYHSTWPLTGRHMVRPPLLPRPTTPPHEPALIQAYIAALREPNKALLLALYVDEGYVREPSGSRFKHAGSQGRAEFYAGLDFGGVVLHHCTATSDRKSYAVEYICDEWATTKLPEQAGMVVYELAPNGLLMAARIYDDITPPSEQ